MYGCCADEAICAIRAIRIAPTHYQGLVDDFQRANPRDNVQKFVDLRTSRLISGAKQKAHALLLANFVAATLEGHR